MYVCVYMYVYVYMAGGPLDGLPTFDSGTMNVVGTAGRHLEFLKGGDSAERKEHGARYVPLIAERCKTTTTPSGRRKCISWHKNNCTENHGVDTGIDVCICLYIPIDIYLFIH
eukprot:GHVU01109019.1.p1 GENE.GHVU01109019.1~~GHVU01109019.1.p1  ORF type:complete len:113 (+),score=5.33 GHVU01109019.1:351-689(+)